MSPTISNADPPVRLAGILYLVVIALGAFANGYVHAITIVPGDAAATAHNILASEALWRLALAAQLLMYLCYAVVTAIFYDVFKVVSRSDVLLATLVSAVGLATGAVNVLDHAAPLVILKSPGVMAAFATSQIEALAYMFLKLETVGFNITLALFGVYCLLIGSLILRSTFLPRILGLLMALSGLCYLANSLAIFLLPLLAAQFSQYVVVASLGELSLSVWLCLIGLNATKWSAHPNRA